MSKVAFLPGLLGLHAIEDTLLIVYFDSPNVGVFQAIGAAMDELMASRSDSLLVAQVVDPGKGFPSIDAQRAAAKMTERIASRTREIITFPSGDSFRALAVRSVIRKVNMLSKKRQIVVETMQEFHDEVRKTASSKTPDRVTIDRVIAELRADHERWRDSTGAHLYRPA
jgi:hypothetical protein